MHVKIDAKKFWSRKPFTVATRLISRLYYYQYRTVRKIEENMIHHHLAIAAIYIIIYRAFVEEHAEPFFASCTYACSS